MEKDGKGRSGFDPESWRELEEVVLQALELPPAERDGFVRQAFPGRTEFRDRAFELLVAHDRSEDFLEDRAVDWLDLGGRQEVHGYEIESDRELAGQRVGPYVLKRPLGRGGMGTVFLAERADSAFDRLVAVKIVGARQWTRELEDRFRQERRILAGLDHPGIARLLDAGSLDDGRAYLVMDFVDGIPITEFCDQRTLSIRSRIRLFLDVCAAVVHAHQSRVIHRDLKPSNILVTDASVPRILDFGIAKVLDTVSAAEGEIGVVGSGSSTHQASDLHSGGVETIGLLWTPGYSSPEQIAQRPLTTASDVFSLGVLLFRLLTGQLPYSPEVLAAAGTSEAADAPDPPLASQCELSGVDSVETARQLRGELDAICCKALQVDPRHRYGTVESLAADLERFLANLPVAVYRNDWAYRARQSIDRQRRAYVIASLVMIALVGAGVLALFQWHRASEQRRVAISESFRAQSAAGFLVESFALIDPRQNDGEVRTAIDLLESAERRIDDQLENQPLLQARLWATIGEAYHHLGLFAEAETAFESALATPLPTGSEAEELRFAAAIQRGHSIIARGDIDRAGEWLGEWKTTSAGEPSVALIDLEVAWLLSSGQIQEAHRTARLALSRLRNADPASEETSSQEALEVRVLTRLAVIASEAGEHQEARTYADEALRLSSGTDNQLTTAHVLNEIGVIEQRRGDLEGAEQNARESLALYEKILGHEHPEIATALNNLAICVQFQGRYQDAEALYFRALALYRKSFGAKHPLVANATNNLATVIHQQGDLERAEPFYQETLELAEPLGDRHPLRRRTLNNYALLLTALGKYESAEPLYRENAVLFEQIYGREHADTGSALVNLAELLSLRGNFAEAAEFAGRARETFATSLPEDHWKIAVADGVLGVCLVAAGESGRGFELLRASLVTIEREKGVESAEARDGRRRLEQALDQQAENGDRG